MEWKNYHVKIIEQRKVRLNGWTASRFDPQQLSNKELDELVQALYSDPPTCYWQELTATQVADEMAAYRQREGLLGGGEGVKKGRKERSDKGVKRRAYAKKRKSAASEDEGGARKKRKVAKAKSVAIEEESEEESEEDDSDEEEGEENSAQDTSSEEEESSHEDNGDDDDDDDNDDDE